MKAEVSSIVMPDIGRDTLSSAGGALRPTGGSGGSAAVKIPMTPITMLCTACSTVIPRGFLECPACSSVFIYAGLSEPQWGKVIMSSAVAAPIVLSEKRAPQGNSRRVL